MVAHAFTVVPAAPNAVAVRAAGAVPAVLSAITKHKAAGEVGGWIAKVGCWVLQALLDKDRAWRPRERAMHTGA